MSHVISPNVNLEERTRGLEKELAAKFKEEKLELEKNDVPALIIAALQVMLPFVLFTAIIMGLTVFVFTQLIMR